MKLLRMPRLPSQQPLVDGRQRQHSKQQPHSQREEEERERLDEEMQADVQQGAGQLLRAEAVRKQPASILGVPHVSATPMAVSYLRFERQAAVEEDEGDCDVGDGDLRLQRA